MISNIGGGGKKNLMQIYKVLLRVSLKLQQIHRSNVAQRKRVWLITRRTVDRNHPLLLKSHKQQFSNNHYKISIVRRRPLWPNG